VSRDSWHTDWIASNLVTTSHDRIFLRLNKQAFNLDEPEHILKAPMDLARSVRLTLVVGQLSRPAMYYVLQHGLLTSLSRPPSLTFR
jgi:hypothetical protein